MDKTATHERPYKVTRAEQTARKAARNETKQQEAANREIRLQAALNEFQKKKDEKYIAQLHANTTKQQPVEQTPSFIQRIAEKSSKVLERLRQKPPHKPPMTRPSGAIPSESGI